MAEEEKVETTEAQVADFLAEHPPEEPEGDEDIFTPPADEDAPPVPVDDEPPADDDTPPGDTPLVDDADDDVPPDDTPPVDDEPPVETPPADDEPPAVSPDVQALMDQNATLLARIEELTAAGLKPAQPAVQDPVPTTEPQQQVTAGHVYDFVGDADLDELLSDKASFNGLISKAIHTAINASQEGMLRAMPNVVSAQVKQQKILQDYVDEFYTQNEDLVGVKKTVGAVTNSVYSEHPDWTIEQVFEETANRTRTMLGLKAKAQGETPPADTPSVPPGKRPALPGKQGARQPASKPVSQQQKHIGDVL